jgi:hypothetical protein
MRNQEIELSIGEALVLGDHLLTLLDIEGKHVLVRVDPHDSVASDVVSAPELSVPPRFAIDAFSTLPR